MLAKKCSKRIELSRLGGKGPKFMQVGEAAMQMLSYIHHTAAEQNDKMGLIKDRERFPHLAACREEEEGARELLTGPSIILSKADSTSDF